MFTYTGELKRSDYKGGRSKVAYEQHIIEDRPTSFLSLKKSFTTRVHVEICAGRITVRYIL